MNTAFKTDVAYPEHPITHDERRFLRWLYLRQLWLYRAHDRESTAIAAQRSTEEWLRFLETRQPGLMPWSAIEADVADWVYEMAQSGVKPRTVSKKLRYCDKWYRFVAHRTATDPEESAGPVYNPFKMEV